MDDAEIKYDLTDCNLKACAWDIKKNLGFISETELISKRVNQGMFSWIYVDIYLIELNPHHKIQDMTGKKLTW